jgi:exosortase D (VPLPA-CTERM-specific)
MTVSTRVKSLLPVILGVLLISAVGVFYWPVLVSLVREMLRNEDSSYGLILPLVSGYIIYRKWPQIRQQPLKPSWLGVVVVAAGFGLFIFGELFQSLYIPLVSFVVVLAGLVILVGGLTLARLLAFPLFLLVFMIPYEGFLVREVTLPLQLISSKLAAGMLRTFGYTVFRHGNVLDLGTKQLNVVAACSGLRYVIDLMALGVIFCYFFQRRFWKVAIILASLIPFAIFANAARIACIGIFPILEKGLWHSSIGLGIFLLGFDYLKLINWTLNRLHPPVPAATSAASQTAGRDYRESAVPAFTPFLITALALVMVVGTVAWGVATVPPRPLLQAFNHFPMHLGPWEGEASRIDQHIFKVTTADTYLNANYANPAQGSVGLWIAYYEDMRRGKNFHSPYICLTGSGWRVIHSQTLNLKPNYPVHYMLMDQGGNRLVVYYWYLQGGQIVSGDYANKLAIGLDLLVNHRSDGALVRLTTPVARDVDTARQRLNSFARLLLPVLPKFIPN